MAEWDYNIIGAGSDRCVLAERLSRSPANSVLLVEAGPVDSSPFIHIPRGVARFYSDPRHVRYFQTEAHDEKLRLRGVAGLHVADGSIMPTMVSANTNGPIMAAAWHAADLILEGKNP